MGESLDIRRKRLTYRSWHRGTKELGLLVGAFAERYLAAMDEAELDLFEALLEVPEPVLYDWITGAAQPPAAYDHAVARRLLAFELKPPIA